MFRSFLLIVQLFTKIDFVVDDADYCDDSADDDDDDADDVKKKIDVMFFLRICPIIGCF